MIAVIGAGPAGCHAAYLLAKQGKKVTVIEEHEKIGLPVQCTGIVTSAINDYVKIKKSIVLNKIRKARIHSKNESVEIRLQNENIVLDRARFDQSIAEKAEQEGAKFMLKSRFIGNSNGRVITTKKEFNAEKIIGADGPLSGVAKINGMFGKRDFWVGVQARVKMENDNAIEFFPNIGTYAWIVPESRDIARIGVAAEKSAKKVFDEFVKHRISPKEVIEYQGGLIPKYNPSQITEKDGVYLIGDAATQVKATTGGGIVQGLAAAEALAESIAKCQSYEKLWKAKIGKDLSLHLRMRNIMDKFSDADWDFLVRIFKKKRNLEIIEKFDRDYPSRFVMKLALNEPRLLYFSRYLV